VAKRNKRHLLLVRWTVVSSIILVATVVWSLARHVSDGAVLPGDQVDGLTSVLARDNSSDQVHIKFEDVTKRMGVAFRHFPAARASLLPEDMGSGVAVGDFDDDGYPDLFFVNISGSIAPDATVDADRGASRLYRNIGGERFEDVTESAGIRFVGCGMGASWGDFDNDGDLDLYITAYGPNAFYENKGDGTFTDITDQAGVQDTRFSAGCSWADYDRDGYVDLYVTNYVDFVYREADRTVSKRQYSTEQPYTLNPSAYEPLPNSLFRNKGDGTFEDVGVKAGVADSEGKSLSAGWVDMNNDGWVDLYVANDVSNNGVFQNRGDGTFEDIGPGSLAADYRGAMGVAVSDPDDDLDQDLLITHWIAQENALYRNMTHDKFLGDSSRKFAWFMDGADETGLGQSSLDMVGWATGFCDFDNDGYRDLWIVNGSTLERPDDHAHLEAQPPFLFQSRGEAGFFEVAGRASDVLADPIVGRGGAHADFDRDGRVDWVILVHGGDAKILRNTSPPGGHWLRVVLRQTGGNTRALGARVYATVAGRTQMAEVGAGSSYLSQDELTLHFGMSDAGIMDELRIVWPDGFVEEHGGLASNVEVRFTHDARYPVSAIGGPFR
jgi:enediyne biosynthesis protein E4